jgi:hypothetical protein
MRLLLTAVLLLAFVAPARADDVENPWKNSKVGDWVEHKTTGANFSGTSKMTITAKDDKEVTYQIEGTFNANGQTMTAPVQKQTIDLTKPYDPVAAATNAATKMSAKGTKIETVGEGKEKLKIGAKEYETTWKKLKATTTVNDMTIVSEYKMWFCKDVPLGGLVRMDTDVAGTTTKLEISGSGSK